MAKDAAAKKQLLISIKAEGKLLKKTLEGFVKSLMENDIYDIKKNSELAALSSMELSQVIKFANDCADGNLSSIISSYTSMDEKKRSVLPERVNELLTGIEDEGDIEEPADSAPETVEAPKTEDTPAEPAEEAPAADSAATEAPVEPTEEAPVAEEPTKEDTKKVEEKKDEKHEKKEEHLMKEAAELPKIATTTVATDPKHGIKFKNEVFSKLEDEFGEMVVDVGDIKVLKQLDNGQYVVKATGIDWEGDMDGGERMDEVAPPGKKMERMVKHIKKSVRAAGGSEADAKRIAYATAWKRYGQSERSMCEGPDDVMTVVMTVVIDHTGEEDTNAAKYGIKIRHGRGNSALATGKKSDLQKYLVAHYYGEKEEAEDIHPEVFAESVRAELPWFEDEGILSFSSVYMNLLNNSKASK